MNTLFSDEERVDNQADESGYNPNSLLEQDNRKGKAREREQGRRGPVAKSICYDPSQ